MVADYATVKWFGSAFMLGGRRRCRHQLNTVVADYALLPLVLGVALCLFEKSSLVHHLQVSMLEERDAATNVPIATLLGTATNNANGINTATPQLWMDPVSVVLGKA